MTFLDATELPSALVRLAAEGPFEPDAAELALFGQFVGAWGVEWTALSPGGGVDDHRTGEWHFAWVLGGRGIQDVIWVDGARAEADGTTLRCWDGRLRAWRAVFMSPGDGQFVSLVGRRRGEDIVQEIIDPDPAPGRARWTFTEITARAFLWRAETSQDAGATWSVTHEMRATRRAT